MIRRLQRQFVLIAAGAIAVLLIALLGVLNYFNFRATRSVIFSNVRLLAEQYNSEPYCALGITWTGFFTR